MFLYTYSLIGSPFHCHSFQFSSLNTTTLIWHFVPPPRLDLCICFYLWLYVQHFHLNPWPAYWLATFDDQSSLTFGPNKSFTPPWLHGWFNFYLDCRRSLTHAHLYFVLWFGLAWLFIHSPFGSMPWYHPLNALDWSHLTSCIWFGVPIHILKWIWVYTRDLKCCYVISCHKVNVHYIFYSQQ